MISRPIHLAANGRFCSFYGWVVFHCTTSSFFFNHICLIDISVDGHLGCFHVLVIVNSTEMNIRVFLCFSPDMWPAVGLLGHTVWTSHFLFTYILCDLILSPSFSLPFTCGQLHVLLPVQTFPLNSYIQLNICTWISNSYLKLHFQNWFSFFSQIFSFQSCPIQSTATALSQVRSKFKLALTVLSLSTSNVSANLTGFTFTRDPESNYFFPLTLLLWSMPQLALAWIISRASCL